VKRLVAAVFGCTALTLAVPATANAAPGSVDDIPSLLGAALNCNFLDGGSSKCGVIPTPPPGAFPAASATDVPLAAVSDPEPAVDWEHVWFHEQCRFAPLTPKCVVHNVVETVTTGSAGNRDTPFASS